MSKNILKIGLAIVGIVLAVPTLGASLGLSAIAIAALEVGIALTESVLLGPSKPKGLTTSPTDRLTATLVPTTPRKIAFGHTALDTDVRYQAFTGSKQEYLEMIVCHASHEVDSIDQLWLDNELAWSAGTVQGRYVGYLTVDTRLVGTSLNGIAIDSNWTATATLTGCAYSHYKFKLTGNSDKVSSPFASGVTSRMTVRGKGAKVYDPRLDGTVAGGVGLQRATDQTTWTWDDNASRNPALQELFYELGWKINSKLAVGKGLPPARIDLASYAVSANHCDESITLNGGGTEPRYRSDGIVSEGDDPNAVRDNLCATMNAVLRDAGGKLALTVIHDDLSTPVTPTGKTAFDQFDVQGQIQWDQTPDLSSSFNIVRGRRIDPSDQALYQPVDFPEVSLTSVDGIDRIDTIDLPFVQSNGQAQRLAKQRLERNQFQGRLTFTGQPSFWGLNLGDVFAFTHPTFGWTAKLFRCASQKINRRGATDIVAVEESSAIYAWANNEAAAVTPGTPVIYDPTNHPIIQGISDALRTMSDPPQSLIFKYTYLLAQDGWTSRDLTFNLNDSSGAIGSGITWAYLIVTGGINGFTSASSSQAMTGTGMGTLTVSSLDSSECQVQVSATYLSKTYTKTITLTREVAAAPVSGGTSGTGGGGTLFSKSSGFSNIASTTFASVSGSMAVTTPTGITALNVSVSLDAMPVSGITGNWTVSLEVLRGGVLVGSVQSSNSNWAASDFAGNPASFLFSVNDTGLTASTGYTYDVQGKLTSGTRSHTVTGTVSITT